MFARMVKTAREIGTFIRISESYEWLPNETEGVERIFMTVLFRARDDALNDVLVQRINSTRKLYVSGTKWKGRKACRIAVSSWRADVDRDLPVIRDVLTGIAKSHGSMK